MTQLTKDEMIDQVASQLFLNSISEWIDLEAGTVDELALTCWNSARIFADAKTKPVLVSPTPAPGPSPAPTTTPTQSPTVSPTPAPTMNPGTIFDLPTRPPTPTPTQSPIPVPLTPVPTSWPTGPNPGQTPEI